LLVTEYNALVNVIFPVPHLLFKNALLTQITAIKTNTKY